MAGLSARSVQPNADDDASAHAALDRAVEHLLDLQDPAGWWKGELETNVTMDAEDLMMRQFLGVRTDEQTAQSATWIRSQQRDDGSWANFRFGPGDVSTSVEAYVALRLAGDDADDQHLKQARQFILDSGGVEATRVFTRIWLSLFGQWSWDDVPALPPEIVLAPAWVPFNVYDWGCWARQTLVPLTILGALRPNRPLGVSVDELRTGSPAPPPAPPTTWRGAFTRLDRALHAYERRPVRSVRKLALRRAAEWVVARQEKDGCWGGIQPPWVYSLMALHAIGYPLDHPVLAAGLAGWERFTIREETPDGTVRRIEACQSPVWDTALALVALGDAGVDPEAGPMVRARDWLLAEEITVRGDWAVRRPHTPAGGWAFEFDNDGYPDTDDTAEVVLGLRRTAESPQVEEAVRRARIWLRGMQCRDGGWGAFDADNTRELAYQLPFCDFGAVIDPPSADVTAHVVEMFAHEGHADDPEVQRAVRWLLDAQEKDGSWFGRWGANHVYGTGAVLPALVAAGLSRHDRAVVRGANWLTAHQNADGGWGEDLRSYTDPTWVGKGTSTASQTAWALLALEAAGLSGSPAVRAGIAWLVATQRPDGGWDEPQFTGTGFPGDFYINYHLYRLVFPVTALGRLLTPAGDAQDRA
ncbi:squalene-hopene/tetraprenyl-beta-curcumene cyclase [Actinopolymorpha cephalotaxi]|uniref:Squalene-hopene/tetraprenyl-beta-curcumene cyclase n=1 Tax=Actinopolymorpha cephalotaxi TaxID=504797 RepID=A0A1I2MS09_9ACTN|nr:squalene--hopene cyclase [Actinopolymorpha cephalotaxi]NYH85866.1 squalene-hopene/tetraprenyl-beta-curcumene cyclase [Actinopolymorpha cephalotaxi]SFF94242.1 squalene-hopene/tetraprenyl-beta-curcumene cyclase [Actinopolymorpha cephalotaxi]